jgi:excisionase family DNA binding protein
MNKTVDNTNIDNLTYDIGANLTNIEDLPLSLTVNNVAKVLDISLASAYELFHSKNFPCFKVGKRGMKISKLAFIEWMKNPNIYGRNVG